MILKLVFGAVFILKYLIFEGIYFFVSDLIFLKSEIMIQMIFHITDTCQK